MIDIEIDNINSVAKGLSGHPLIVKHFSAYVPGYKYMYKYKAGLSLPFNERWDGKISVIDGEKFPTGLLPLLASFLDESKLQFSVMDNRKIRTLHVQPTSVILRPYQDDAITKALTNMLFGSWWPRGVIQVATGGGKTEMAAAMIQMTSVPTIFLVHRKDLQVQTIERFAKYGILAGELDTLATNDVTVCTVQSLLSFSMKFEKEYETADGKKKTRNVTWLNKKRAKQGEKGNLIRAALTRIEQVFVDEAHLIASKQDYYNMFGTALQLMPNAYMRWGLTATPFLRNQLHDWLLEGCTGPAIVRITNRELIDTGFLTECKVDMVLMRKQEVPKDQRSWPTCYDFYIVTNRIRNAEIVNAFKKYPGPTLILVNKISHGDILASMLNIPFLSGQSSASDRRQAIEDMRNSKLSGVVASTIFDEGIDIASIKTVILAGGGKSEIKNLQRLGRGLRLANGKQQLQLVDFLDQSPYILSNHSKIRRKLWEGQGFTVSMTTPK